MSASSPTPVPDDAGDTVGVTAADAVAGTTGTTGASGATVVWVLLRVRPAEEARFLAAAATLAERSLADEPGCLQYDVVSLDPAVCLYGIYEVYRDEAALTAHHAAPHYAAWDAVAPTFFEDGGASVRIGTRVVP